MLRAVPALFAIAALGLVAAPLDARSARKRSDLAEMAAGVYLGDVISDARGSSRSGVTISVDRTGPDEIRVTSDYERLPEFTVKLTRAMDTIQQVGTEQVFLLDLSKNPRTLMVTVDDASWSGTKQE